MKSSRQVEFLDGPIEGEYYELPYDIKTVTLHDNTTTYHVIGNYAMTDPDERLERVSYRQVYSMEFVELAGPGVVLAEITRVLYSVYNAVPGTVDWAYELFPDTNEQAITVVGYAFKEGIE